MWRELFRSAKTVVQSNVYDAFNFLLSNVTIFFVFFVPKQLKGLSAIVLVPGSWVLPGGVAKKFLYGGLFEPWRLKSTMISIIAVWIVYIFRLMWTFFEINSSDFILFVDREFTYLFTWSRITIYLFRLNSWTFGGVRVFVRHWSINIYFYSHRCPNFWIANFSIVFRLLIILLALRIWFKN